MSGGLQRALDAVRRHPRAADAALALLLAALVEWEILTTDVTGPKWLLVPAGLAMTVPLAWRRVAPLPALLFVMAASAAAGLAAADSDEVAQAPQLPFLAEVLAVYSVAAHAERRPALIGLLVSWAALIAGEPGDFVVMGPAWAGIWLAGRLVRAREQDARRLRELAQALDRERVEEARLAVAEERTRIARELHDVVAHAMSTIVLEAGAERVNLDEGQTSARQALHSIERTGRQALAEMRRLVGVLRTEDDEPELFPQPSLTQLDLLIEQVGRAGLPVELRVVGEPVQLAPGLDISAYRIVQEALTNVLKHGGDARATVVVAYGDRMLEIEIADDGRGGTPDGSGHGIVGLRERVALFGGSLEAGGREGGGFAVRARLPLENGPPMSVRVLIADDQAVVRSGLRRIMDVDAEIEVVGEAVDGLAAVDAARRLAPHLVLMDIRMPRLDGLAATRRIIAEHDDPPRVLILTTFGLDEYVYEALRGGRQRVPAQGCFTRGHRRGDQGGGARRRAPRPGGHGLRDRPVRRASQPPGGSQVPGGRADAPASGRCSA